MSILTVTTPFNIDVEFKIAPFHKRLLAWLIDILIIYSFIYLMFRFVEPLFTLSAEARTLLSIFGIMLPAYAYHFILELLLNGQTVGKKAMGIQVMDITGNEPTVGQYLLRWVFRLVDMGVTMGIGAVLSAALTNHTQRLGDLAAGTIVIDRKAQTGLHETIYLEIEDENYKAKFPEVMKLTDRDISGIRNLLNIKANKDADVYMAQVAHRIKDVLKLDTTMEPRELLEQLLHDYNFLTRK